jgi:hypothetical protein
MRGARSGDLWFHHINGSTEYHALLMFADGTVKSFRPGYFESWVNSTTVYTFGDPSLDGAWRFTLDVDTVKTQRRESGLWITKRKVIPEGPARPITTVSGTYQATFADKIILADGTFVITLPDLTGVVGVDMLLRNEGSGTVTVDGFSTQRVNGDVTQTLYGGESFTLTPDGAAWHAW